MNITIILPIRNEEVFIEKTLMSIINQKYPSEKVEIIIVDGMSTDNTLIVVNDVIKRFPNQKIKILENSKKIAPSAMNIGLLKSSGDLIIRVDGHSYLDSNYLNVAVEKMRDNPNISCVGGPITTISENKKAKSISNAMSSPFGVGNALFRYSDEERFVDTLAFGAYRNDVFKKIGLFNEELVRNQDDEFNLRLTKSGGKILLTPDMNSYYVSRSSFSRLWSQYNQYGYWKVRVQQIHKGVASIRHLVPSLFVMGNIFGLLSVLFLPVLSPIYFAFLGIYLFLNLYFSTKVNDQRSISNILNTSISFIILHLSYGFGYIKGFIDFILLKKGVNHGNNI